MNRPELFEKTVDILVTALKNDTLKHQDPCGCAVGNMIAASCGYEVRAYNSNPNTLAWYTPGTDNWIPANWYLRVLASGKSVSHNEQTRVTGYDIKELRSIEDAFEDRDEEGYSNGRITREQRLSRVYDVLCTIHEVDAGDMIGDNPFEPVAEIAEVVEA